MIERYAGGKMRKNSLNLKRIIKLTNGTTTPATRLITMDNNEQQKGQQTSLLLGQGRSQYK